ncbi:NAD(P)H-dependent oxidoreductase [Clostridium sp. KNHs205]|uniref:flavodoxin family protein n=1 Tax=Clostridium sp. KNHs205 TaxID=1449050 RepID=UPI00051BEC0D|nr:NAD(P)H-dependent oxidoreductase [Clostridium sp. KNHs205]
MSILMINGSPNKDGNTMDLAKALLGKVQYCTIHLVDCKIYSYGQEFADDQFDETVSAMKEADTIVIGSPVYWHNMSGAVRTLLDRFYGPVSQGELHGRKLFFLFQGAAPEKWMLENSEYTMKRFASLYGMTYMGMATNTKEAKKLSESVS